MVGSVIENYKIMSVLGEGGMGVVYKALDMKLERFVALKILSAQSAGNPQFIERFKREARNQAKLNHPNIVPVYGFTDEDGVLGIVMEYVEGETLEKIVSRKKRLEPVESLNIIKQILQGVGYAHSKGFIHRDIKPSNIIISKEGAVKIMDFGISKSMFDKGITKTGTKIGTILYMSPEQIRAEEPTRQSDIYSIGVTFFEMLIGKTPFDFGTEYEIMEAHLKRNPGRVSGNLDSIPPEIDKIVGKALEKSPVKRYPTCEEFLEDIEVLLAKVDKHAKAPQKVRDKSRESRAYKIRVTLMTIFALTLFVALAAFFFSQIRDALNMFHIREFGATSDTTAGYKNSANYQLIINWKKLNSGTTQNLNSVFFIDNNIGYACGEHGTVITTTDAGENWKTLNTPDSITFNDIWFLGSQSGLVVGEKGKIFKTEDGGNSWTPITTGVGETLLKIVFLSNGSGFIIGGHGVLLRSVDRGNSWSRLNSNTDRLLYSIYFPDNTKGYIVGRDGLLLRTEDGGYSWAASQLQTDNYLKDIFFTDTKTGFISGGGGQLLKTTNTGAEWQVRKCPSSAGLFSILFVDASRGFIVSNKGEILETRDNGDTWELKQSGNFNSLARLSKTQNNTVFACGYNGTILRSR